MTATHTLSPGTSMINGRTGQLATVVEDYGVNVAWLRIAVNTTPRRIRERTVNLTDWTVLHGAITHTAN